MKTLKFGLVIFATLMFGLMTSTCTRTAIDDPGMTGYAGYQVILSGTANPSTLFVPQGTGWVNSRITMRATLNNGAPFGEGRIMLKINDNFGQFENEKDYAFINLNIQGVGSVKYRVNRLHREKIGSEATTYIYAVLQDDNRLDSEGSLIYDYIPIKLITDYEPVDTLSVSTTDIYFDVSGNPTGLPYFTVTNSTSTFAISYTITVSEDWVDYDGFDGNTPDTITLYVEANITGSNRTATITLTAPDTGVNNSPQIILVHQAGT